MANNFSNSPKIKSLKRKIKPKVATSHNFKFQKPKESKISNLVTPIVSQPKFTREQHNEGI